MWFRLFRERRSLLMSLLNDCEIAGKGGRLLRSMPEALVSVLSVLVILHVNFS